MVRLVKLNMSLSLHYLLPLHVSLINSLINRVLPLSLQIIAMKIIRKLMVRKESFPKYCSKYSLLKGKLCTIELTLLHRFLMHHFARILFIYLFVCLFLFFSFHSDCSKSTNGFRLRKNIR